MLEHSEGFELEAEFEEIWEKIRYKKIDKIYQITKEAINILEKHIDDKMLFHKDCYDVWQLFQKGKRANFFYFSGDADYLIKTANPKFENVYKRRKCVRKLKYIGGEEHDDIVTDFKRGEIYTSTHYNGATYTIDMNGKERVIGSLYFERVS